MKKLFISILMITGLSLSSQVNDLHNSKSYIIATPESINPNSGAERITCSAGNGYYVGNGCACANIHCSNGNKYTWCVCADGAIFGGAANHINPTIYPQRTGIPIDITLRLLEDPNTNLDATSRVINIQKIKNAVISIDTEMHIDYLDYTLIITSGEYEVRNNQLQILCTLK